MSIFNPPVPIDASAVTFSDLSAGAWAFTGQVYGPHSFGGKLFIGLMTDQNALSSVFNIWKSADNGETWAILDPGGAPTVSLVTLCFDGVQTISVAFGVVAIFPINVPMKIIDFDLVSETWGAASINAPDTVSRVALIFPRPDGSKIVVYSRGVANAPLGPDALVLMADAVSFLSGTWSATFSFDANAQAVMTLAGEVFDGGNNIFGCVDSTGRAHVVFMETGKPAGSPVIHMFYQAISTTDALGSFFEFPGLATVISDQPDGFGIPCIEGANIVFPLWTISGANVRMGAYIGAGLAAPAWTLFADIDPMFPANSFTGNLLPPAAGFLSGVVTIAYVAPTADLVWRTGILRLSSTSDFAIWVFASLTAFDIEIDPSVIGLTFTVLPMVAPAPLVPLGLAITAVDPTSTSYQRFFFPPLGGGSPLALADSPPVGKVGVSYGPHCFIASGGTPPYVSYLITAGSLPPGLALDPLTGCVTGTPSVVGTFCFTVTVTDSIAGMASVSACITIALNVIIQLIGWKLYPDSPCETAVEAVEAPHVKRAV